MGSFEIATVGDNCIDRYLPPIGLATVGGNAVNVAVHLQRLGRCTAYFGAVGPDKAGAWTRASLTENDVDIEHLVERRGRTAYTDLDVDADGDRIIAFEDFGVCRGYRPSAAEIDLLRAAKHLHLGWLDDGGALKRRLAAGGVSISQDLAVNAGADRLAIAFASAGAVRPKPESRRWRWWTPPAPATPSSPLSSTRICAGSSSAPAWRLAAMPPPRPAATSAASPRPRSH